MVNKIKVYVTNDGKIFPKENITLSDGFITSDGKIFLDELEAYKYDNKCLENNRTSLVIDHNVNSEIANINGVDISGFKTFDVSTLAATSCTCIPNTSLIYLWYNVFEKLPYIGSSKTPRLRASTFINMDLEYAGNKINKARERYSGVYGIAWKYFILEENIEENILLDREGYYIDKFNSISNGYNTMIPRCTCYQDKNGNEIKQRAFDLFSSFCKRVENWGMTIGESVTAETYFGLYDLPKYLGGKEDRRNPYSTRYPSFRLSCFMNGTTIVEQNNLKKLLHGVNQIIDGGKNGFKNDSEIFPSSMIRYRMSDHVYLSIDDNVMTFETAGDAVKYRVENLRKKILDGLDENIDKDEYYFVDNAPIDTIIDLCYHDAEKIKKFISDSKCDKSFLITTKDKPSCYTESDIKSQELFDKYAGITINGKLVEFKNVLTYYNCWGCAEENGIFLFYNTIEKKPFLGATIDLSHRLKSFFYVGAFGGKKIDEVRKKYYDNKDAWVIFIIEENVPETELDEMFSYYVDIFDSINNGYNTRRSTGMLHSEELAQKRHIRTKITEEKKFIKTHYGIFKENVLKHNMILDDSLTLEAYSIIIKSVNLFDGNYSFMKRDIDKYPSFRIPCLLNDTNVVTSDIVQFLPYGIVKHIDTPKEWYMCDTEVGKIPSFMRYNIFTKEYTAYGLCGKKYPTLKEALIAYCDMLIDKLHQTLNRSVKCFDIDDRVIEYIENMNFKTLFEACFKNPEPLIEILNS